MDSAFSLNEEGRSNFLQFVLHSFGCTYICLWSYLPLPSNCLLYKDGIYNEHHQREQSSSSSYTPIVSRGLFDEYRNSVFMVQNDTVPGLAFKNKIPYFQLKDLELIRLASIQLQSQFYQEAKIKTVIFMGCESGEIELGFSHEHTQMNIEIEIRNWLQQNLFQNESIPQTTTNQSRILSSSSSSLRSMESSEFSPLLFNKPSTPSSYMHHVDHFKETSSTLEQALFSTVGLRTTFHNPQGQTHVDKQAMTQTQNNLFPSLASDIDAAMARAMFAVISSSSSSPSSLLQTHLTLPSHFENSAFKRYNESGLRPSQNIVKSSNLGSHSMFKRAIMYLRSLSLRTQVTNMQVNLPSRTQLHHMISERKRREKLNDSFQSLRSLIPPGSKRDKASILANTRDYLTTLKAQVSDLTHKNELLEARLSSISREYNYDTEFEKEEDDGSSHGRIKVRVTDLYESTSTSTPTQRMVTVTVRVFSVGNGCLSKMDIAVQLLEFFKTIENVSLLSMSTNTQVAESSQSSNLVMFKLKLEGELDKSTFEEALKEYLVSWYNAIFSDKGE